MGQTPSLVGGFGSDHSSFFLVFETVAVAFDVDGGGVVQQLVEDGRGDDIVGEDRPPVAVPLVGGQDDRDFS